MTLRCSGWTACFLSLALVSCSLSRHHPRVSGYPGEMAGPLVSLAALQSYRAARVSSADRAGNADFYPLHAWETYILAELDGPGEITHFWITISSEDPDHLRNMVLRVYYDGNNFPSVESPVGDFFGLGHGRVYTFGNLVQAIGTHKGMNSFWPMPFRKSALVTVTNESSIDAGAFYYYVDWRKLASFPPNGAYFHAQYRQAFPCPDFSPYLLLDTEGARGHYVGVSLSVHTQVEGWWGEGDDIITVDGEPVPSLWGTGSEDYFCGAWCFQEPFSYAYFGMPYRLRRDQEADNYWNVYRYHLENPIPFKRSIRVEIEHGASGFDNTRKGGHNNDYSSVAYWYMKKPVRLKGTLPPAEQRISVYRPIQVPREILEVQRHDRSSTPTEGVSLQSQDMGVYTRRSGAKWYNADQLFCQPNITGSVVQIAFDTSGTLQGPMVLRLTQARDYGKIRISLDGQILVPEFDGYHTSVRAVQVSLGDGFLPEGHHTLLVETLGKDDQSRGVLWGIDYLRIGGQVPDFEASTPTVPLENLGTP